MPESPYDTTSLLAKLSVVVDSLSTAAGNLKKPFPLPPDPAISPQELHNLYVGALYACYVSKYRELTDAVIAAERDSNFLVYALSGRALLETTATLRYYVENKYRPLFDKGDASQANFEELIEIDDRHLRGGRFDWELFFTGDFVSLAKQEKGAPPSNFEPGVNPKAS